MTQRAEFLTEMEDILDLAGGSLSGTEVLDDCESWDSLAVLSFSLLAERMGRKVPVVEVRNAETVDDLYALVSGAPALSEYA